MGVRIRWNNVLDKDYTTVYGYNTPGSNVFVNLSFGCKFVTTPACQRVTLIFARAL